MVSETQSFENFEMVSAGILLWTKVSCFIAVFTATSSRGHQSSEFGGYQIDFETGSGQQNNASLLPDLYEGEIPVDRSPTDILTPTAPDRKTDGQRARQETVGGGGGGDKAALDSASQVVTDSHSRSASSLGSFHESLGVPSFTSSAHLDTVKEPSSAGGVGAGTRLVGPGVGNVEREPEQTWLLVETAAPSVNTHHLHHHQHHHPEATSVYHLTSADDREATGAGSERDIQPDAHIQAQTPSGGDERVTWSATVKPMAAPRIGSEETRINSTTEHNIGSHSGAKDTQTQTTAENDALGQRSSTDPPLQLNERISVRSGGVTKPSHLIPPISTDTIETKQFLNESNEVEEAESHQRLETKSIRSTLLLLSTTETPQETSSLDPESNHRQSKASLTWNTLDLSTRRGAVGGGTAGVQSVSKGHSTVTKPTQNFGKSRFKGRTGKSEFSTMTDLMSIVSVQSSERSMVEDDHWTTAKEQSRSLVQSQMPPIDENSSIVHSRSVLLNLDGESVRIALNLRIRTAILDVEGPQTMRKLKLLLEHQVNRAFLDCPGFIESEINDFRTGSILADGHLLFDASFLLLTTEAAKKIRNYVISYAVPLMTSSTPFGRVDPDWTDPFVEQLVALEHELSSSPCQRLGSVCGPCSRCRHNDSAIWCSSDCDSGAHQTCALSNFRSEPMEYNCACEEFYVSINGTCVVFWLLLLLPLSICCCLSLAAVALLIFCLVKEKKRQRKTKSSPFSRNRVDRLLSTRASVWMTPKQSKDKDRDNGGDQRMRRRTKAPRKCTPAVKDLFSPSADSSAVTSPPSFSIATETQLMMSTDTFTTFGKRRNDDDDVFLENSDVRSESVVNDDSTMEPTSEMIFLRSARGHDPEDIILKDELLISLLLKNAFVESMSDESSRSDKSSKESGSSTSTDTVNPHQPEFSSFYI